jgi:putative aldouronate transport system substrate-binding protein
MYNIFFGGNMMSRRRKYISLSLVAMLVIGLLAACSSTNDGGGKTSDTTPANSDSSNNATRDPYEIVLATPVFGAIPKDVGAVQEEISKITKKKINATVKILPISIGVWAQQLNLMSSAGEKLDLFFELGQAYSSDVALGKLVPLDDLLNKYGQGIKQQIDVDYLSSTKVNGKIYAVPVVKDYTTGIPGIVMRKDLVEKYKIDVSSIKSIDDLDRVFKIIKDNEPNIVPLGAGLAIPSSKYVWYDKLGDSFGVLPGFDNGLKVVNLYETKEYEDYLNKVHSWFKAGYINKDAATSQVNPSDMVRADKAFSYFVGLKPGGLEGESMLSGRELVFAPLLPKAYATTSDTLQSLWAISNNSANPERAMMFLNLLYTDKDLANLFLYGIEGKHYVKVSETTIDYPPGIDAETVGYSNQIWLVPNASIAYTRKTDAPEIWKQTLEANKNAVKSKALGFMFNSEPVKNEVTALNNVVLQYGKGLETGTLDPAEKLQEFRAKLKAAGIDKVIAEKQKQLDAWAAANKK